MKSDLTSLEFDLLCSVPLVVAGGGALVWGALEGVLCNMICHHGNNGSKRIGQSRAMYTRMHMYIGIRNVHCAL